MNKAHFVFTKYFNSFSVHVKNLEKLSVEQIQTIEEFVKARKGVFDFDSYSFVIQKRLDFNEFVILVQKSMIDAVCEEVNLETNKSAKVEFGKYKGMFYKELPDSYLLWLKSNYSGKNRNIIEKELSSRNL